MREIKFRADDGMGWIYSSAVEYREEDDQWLIFDFEEDKWLYCTKPEQYTGLTDKNGRKIYERDVLKRRVHVVMYGTDLNEWVDEIVEVEWREDYAGFFIGERPLYAEVGATIDRSTLCGCTQFEIIGNVFENPELLEGEG